jgi:hypothetical protein
VANAELLILSTPPTLKYSLSGSPDCQPVLKAPSLALWKAIRLAVSDKGNPFRVKDALKALELTGRPIDSPNRYQLVRGALTEKTDVFVKRGPGLYALKTTASSASAAPEGKDRTSLPPPRAFEAPNSPKSEINCEMAVLCLDGQTDPSECLRTVDGSLDHTGNKALDDLSPHHDAGGECAAEISGTDTVHEPLTLSPGIVARDSHKEFQEKTWKVTTQRLPKEDGEADVAVGKTCGEFHFQVAGRRLNGARNRPDRQGNPESAWHHPGGTSADSRYRYPLNPQSRKRQRHLRDRKSHDNPAHARN